MVLNFAHRGFKANYPENTLYAFSKAIKSADGIEFDVHLSKDGIPVIIHDETLERTTDGSGFVKDLPLAELKQFNAAINSRDFEHLNEKIPTLEEYFNLVKHEDIISNIELKTNIFEYPGIENAVYELITKYGLEKNCIVSSFNHKTLKRFKDAAPEVACGVLTSDVLFAPADYVKALGCEYFHPSVFFPPQDIVALHEQNIRVNVWHSAVPASYFPQYKAGVDALIKAGVDGVITDFEDLF